jgi:hypothetical protein
VYLDLEAEDRPSSMLDTITAILAPELENLGPKPPNACKRHLLRHALRKEHSIFQ